MSDIVDLEDWGRDQTNTPIPQGKAYRIRLWDGDGFNEIRVLTDDDVSGRQILEAFERYPSDEFELLMLTRAGRLESVGLSEMISLRGKGPERFFAFKTDRLLNVVVDGKRLPWGAPQISGKFLRLIFRIPANKSLVLQLKDVADKIIGDDDFVILSDLGLERLYTQPKGYKLDVQGVTIVSLTSEIVVSDALVKAGIDPSEGWIAILKVAGQPRKEVSLMDTIDLSNQGIEKLRLRPNEINNGEAPMGLRRDFDLLDKDAHYLDQRHPNWETHIESGRRWLILPSFKLPVGYNHSVADIAVDIPDTYPSAGIDMFFCLPHLALASGVALAQTQARVQIGGQSFQQWSRHLNGATRWNPNTDSVISHMALVDECLAREVPAT